MPPVMTRAAETAPPPPAAPPPPHENPAAADEPQRTLRSLVRVLQLRGPTPCWIIDGFGDGIFDPVDIDILMPRHSLPNHVARTTTESREQLGATLISWDRDHQFVLACDTNTDGESQPPQRPKFLRVHLRPDYRRVGRYFYAGDEVLAAQPPRAADDAESFATPVSPREFACYLIEKIVKTCLTPTHERVLSDAFRKDPAGCTVQIGRFWSSASASLIASAAKSGNWEVVRRAQGDLRRELRRGAFLRRPFWTIGYRMRKGIRRIVEFIRPSSGLHVVMLGPDGVGKSTVVEVLQRDLAPAFCGIEYGTFAPALLPHKPPPEGGGQPHGKPPRSLPASIVKALWWIVYYSLGYHFTIRPVVARGGLALNHRYCVDAIVDSRRYRYKGPQWLLHLAWRLAHKPDLVFLLDAPPEVVQARKKEVAFEETVRQRDAYRKLVQAMPYGHVIDSTQPVSDVVADVERIIFQFMADRTARRLGLEKSATAPAQSLTGEPAINVNHTAAAAAAPDASAEEAPQVRIAS